MTVAKTFLAVVFLTTLVALRTVVAAPILWVGDGSANLGTVDAATGTVNLIGNMGTAMTDIAFDPSGNLFGVDFGSNLFAIDRNTASATPIGALGIFVNSLVFDGDGNLFAANTSLHSVNVSSGAASLIGSGGDPYSSSGDLAFIGGDLFLSSTPGDTLVRLDSSTGVGTAVGGIGFTSVFGLATNNNIDLFGTAGTEILSVDLTTGAGSSLVDYSGQGLGAAFGSAFFEEAGAGAPVPEPTTLALFGLAIAGIGLAKRRKIAAR